MRRTDHRALLSGYNDGILCGMGGSVVPALETLLARHHVGLTAEEVLDELDAAFAAIPGAGAAPLSPPEVRFLRSHAGPGAAGVIDGWSSDRERQVCARAAVRELGDTLAGSVSIKEAAALLQIDRSSVSRRITAKQLWAFDFHGHRRIPRWQFLGRELLAGLVMIVPAIPRDAPPASLEAFMHTPQPDFSDQTPIEHLAAGGDPTLVARFITDLARW